jgi:HAMP domain-containing protein
VDKRYRLDAWIVAACLIFVGVLALSAFLERDVLRLHILQSFIYVAVI